MTHDILLSLPYCFQTEDRRGLVSRCSQDRILANFLLRSINSLWKLHHRAAAVDTFFDARLEPDTSRAAWNEIRDNVERGAIQHDSWQDLRLTSVLETQARQAFLNTLTLDIINPLTALKVRYDILARLGILGSNLSERKRKTARESGSKKISKIPLRPIPTTPRTPSPSSSEHTSRNAKKPR